MDDLIYTGYGHIASSSEDQKEGWYYVKVDDTIGEYYKWLYSRAFKTWYPCMNGCHITFIAGEKDDRIVRREEMNNYFNLNVSFLYSNVIYTNGRAFWIDAKSDDLDRIRETIGLRKREKYHITLGNIKNESQKK